MTDADLATTVVPDELLAANRVSILLSEYQKAQDSAQHHDTLVWSSTATVWAANLVLVGFVVSNVAKPHLRVALISLAILAVILDLVLWRFVWSFNWVKRQKYQRCKEIEALLGMAQHRALKFPGRYQSRLYALVILALVVVWFGLLLLIVSSPN